MSLAAKITSLRKQKGWTQEYLGEKVGVLKTQVTRWETGRMRPSMKMLKKIAAVFGVTIEDLMGEDVALPTAGNPELETYMRQLQELDPSDQKMVFRIIDTFAKQKRLAQVLAPPA